VIKGFSEGSVTENPVSQDLGLVLKNKKGRMGCVSSGPGVYAFLSPSLLLATPSGQYNRNVARTEKSQLAVIPFHRTWPPEHRCLAWACSVGKCVVLRAGEAYDASRRIPNRKF